MNKSNSLADHIYKLVYNSFVTYYSTQNRNVTFLNI